MDTLEFRAIRETGLPVGLVNADLDTGTFTYARAMTGLPMPYLTDVEAGGGGSAQAAAIVGARGILLGGLL